MEAFCNYVDEEYNKYTYQVHRLNMYAYDDNNDLKALSEIDLRN